MGILKLAGQSVNKPNESHEKRRLLLQRGMMGGDEDSGINNKPVQGVIKI